MPNPTPGQKTIPIDDWKRFLKVADWWDRTFGHKRPGANRPTYGHDMIVKTPAGGIAARVGTTISSEACIKCVEADDGTPGELIIHETDEEVAVYNIYPDDVAEEVYVPTGLTETGTRYVSGEPCP